MSKEFGIRAYFVAAVFVLGELWGHTGHGVPVKHIVESALIDFWFVALMVDGMPRVRAAVRKLLLAGVK